MGTTALVNLGNAVDPSVSTFDNVLSQCRGIAGAVTSGVAYRLLYGVSRETAPTGNYLAYNYDSFQRLISIKDRNNKLITEYGYSDSPGAGNSYIRSYSPDSAVTSTPDLMVERLRIATTYFDGIYRPVQLVRQSASTTQKDVVSMTSYNWYSSQVKQYLPYTVSSQEGYRTSALSEQQSFYNAHYSGEGSYANTRSEYEESPLQRVVKEYIQGSAYSSASRTVSYTYGVNASSEVRYWGTNASGTALVNNGYYAAGALYKVTTTDADSRVSITYTDKQGNVIESRQGSSPVLKTSYVYDKSRRLVYVITPAAQQQAESDPSNTALCYYYKYDNRNRVTEQYIPGKGSTYHVYDTGNRLVFTQDPNMRTVNRWQFIRYDKLSRELMTGIVSYGSGASALRSSYAQVSYSEVKSTAAGNLAGYTNT